MHQAHPALERLLTKHPERFSIGEVCVQRRETAFEVRHVRDTNLPPTALASLNLQEVRHMAQHASDGTFRSLKSAPTLQSGWRFEAKTLASLELALNYLYPGAIADAGAALGNTAPAIFAQFAARQTGKYARLKDLSLHQIGNIIGRCCTPSKCLKLRLWTFSPASAPAAGPAPRGFDATQEVPIACHEPCPWFMDAAAENRDNSAERQA